MGKAISKEVREKIIRAYEYGAGTIEKIAIIFEIKPRSVAKYLHLHRQNKDLTPKPHTGRPPILNDENLDIVKLIVSSNKDGTLQEYADEFKNRTGIEVTYVTMHNACKKLNINRKKRVSTRKSKKELM
jgi:transposase